MASTLRSMIFEMVEIRRPPSVMEPNKLTNITKVLLQNPFIPIW